MDMSNKVSSALLRRPWLFDHLSPLPGLARDFLLWAILKNKATVKLSVPSFCQAFGYKRAALLRPCTPVELLEVRRGVAFGESEDSLNEFSNVIGLVLFRLMRNNFYLPELQGKLPSRGISSTGLLNGMTISYLKKGGFGINFKLGKELLADVRSTYHTLNLAEYLSIRMPSSMYETGYSSEPDDAARKMFLHLSWKRQWWDHMEKINKLIEAADRLGEGADPAKGDYQELLRVAGLANQKDIPVQELAGQLRRLLERVGAMPSIRLLPHLAPVEGEEGYEVSWMRLELANSVVDVYCAFCQCEPGVVKVVSVRNTLKI